MAGGPEDRHVGPLPMGAGLDPGTGLVGKPTEPRAATGLEGGQGRERVDGPALAGQAERLAGQTNFRVAASRAYYGLVGARITSWNEMAIDGRPTLGEFMERRLAPAMRTCVSVAERQQGAIERIARTVQILNTRVEVASEIVNVSLLASMDNRSRVQLRLQETVEGLSIVAVSYYALSLLKVAFDGVAVAAPWLDPIVATALSVPVVLYLVWRFLRGVKKSVLSK